MNTRKKSNNKLSNKRTDKVSEPEKSDTTNSAPIISVENEDQSESLDYSDQDLEHAIQDPDLDKAPWAFFTLGWFLNNASLFFGKEEKNRHTDPKTFIENRKRRKIVAIYKIRKSLNILSTDISNVCYNRITDICNTLRNDMLPQLDPHFSDLPSYLQVYFETDIADLQDDFNVMIENLDFVDNSILKNEYYLLAKNIVILHTKKLPIKPIDIKPVVDACNQITNDYVTI